ncbi:MAG TPA: hypothetical protein DEQ02_04615 [Ruminococcaceae bacterium]|nr:hypothetical protein [Oscillospiraceae bacterium]
MNFVKRGITSVIRKPGKTVILLLIVFVLGNVISFAVSIGQAVDNAENALRQRVGVAAMLEADWQTLDEVSQSTGEYPEPGVLTPETMKKIGALPYVKDFDYTIDFGLQSKKLKRFYVREENRPISEDGLEYYNLKGVNDPEIVDLKENKIKLLPGQGRTFNKQEMESLTYVALVSQKLAEINNLSVGSKFQLDNVIYDYSDIEARDGMSTSAEADGGMKVFASQTYEFEVIGIFEPVEQKKSSGNNNGMDDEYLTEEAQNRIYVPASVGEASAEYNYEQSVKMDPETFKDLSKEDLRYYQNLYILNDSRDIEKFREEALALAPDYYMVTDTAKAFDQIAAPMKSIQSIANIVLIGAAAAAIIILTLLVTLFLRDRRHEIGIYLSLGERKLKIVSQILLEVAAIAMVGIVLSLFSGNLVSGGISKTMLNNEIVARAEEQEEQQSGGSFTTYTSTLDWMGYGNNLSDEDLTGAYRVSLDLRTVLLFFAVGIGTVVVSTLVPIIYVLRLNPKKILM